MSEPNSLPVIYIVDASMAVTGAFVAARNTATALAGIARIVLVLPKGSAILAADLQAFWRVEYLPIYHLSKNFWALVRYMPGLLIAAQQLQKKMRQDCCVRLQLNDFYLMHGAVLRLLGFRGQIVSWVRCDPEKFAGPLARPMLAVAHASANQLIAVSNYIRALVPARYKTDMVYDYAMIQSTHRAIATRDDEKRFVYIANYIHGKGQEVALQAFATAHPRHPAMRLHFYGGTMGLPKNQAYRQFLEKSAQQLGISQWVHFHDFTPDTQAILQTAYAALNCSAAESFSMTVLEAMSNAVPVIATASGGPQEIMVDGKTGHIIPVGDVAALAAEMLRLVANPEVAFAMGRQGAAHVQQKFSKQVFIEKMQALWRLASLV